MCILLRRENEDREWADGLSCLQRSRYVFLFRNHSPVVIFSRVAEDVHNILDH